MKNYDILKEEGSRIRNMKHKIEQEQMNIKLQDYNPLESLTKEMGILLIFKGVGTVAVGNAAAVH